MRTLHRLLATAFVFIATLSAGADAIDDYVRAQMRDLRLPGVAVAVVRDGKAVTQRTYGTANLELGAPVTTDTVFELGSLSKQFTSMLIMMLVEEGKVGLDESVATYLADVPQAWRPITVRHLLTHSSGIQEYLAVPGLPGEAHAASHEAMTRLFFERLKLEFAAGETWAYSNSAYLMLGHLIERVTGKSYWAVLHERILAPLGMTSTRSSDPRAIIRNRAAGYGWSGTGYENRDALSENAYSAGAIVSTLRDMIRWEEALHARKLVTRRSYDAMWTPLTVTRGAIPPFSYGFGWAVDRGVVLHSGGTPGFSTAIHRYLDPGVTVIVLANHGDRVIDHVAQEIAGLAEPKLARRREARDPTPAKTKNLENVLRALIAGKHDPALFTPAMRLFLSTATGRGLWEWIGSHGELASLTYASPGRYSAKLGEATLWFSFTFADNGELAQIYWW